MLFFDHSGVPRELVRRLREMFGLERFIEAGTYHGDTARWAATLFAQVITIERAEGLYQETKNRRDAGDIQYLLGDTRDHLPPLVKAGSARSVLWLDAHWSGGETAGQGDECPLLSEIAIIAASGTPHFVLIDDARFFLSPPPPPHRSEQWPTLTEVLSALSALAGDPYVIVFQDVIIAVPALAKDVVIDYCRAAYKDGATFAAGKPPSLFRRGVSRLAKIRRTVFG